MSEAGKRGGKINCLSARDTRWWEANSLGEFAFPQKARKLMGNGLEEANRKSIANRRSELKGNMITKWTQNC